jgi:hypothetical protein
MTSSRQQLDGVGKLRRYANRRAAAGGAPVTVALIVLVLALGSNASASTNRSATTNAPAAVTPSPGAVVTISPLEHGRPVPAGFVGLSLEYRSLLSYLGTDPSTINPVFVRLLRALTPGQAPVLRIGGDSTDLVAGPPYAASKGNHLQPHP